MRTTFSIGAAPKVDDPAKMGEGSRFSRPIKLTISAEDAEHIAANGNVITFECDKFDVIKSLSTRTRKKLFDIQQEGKKVTVKVSDNYVTLPVSFILYLF